MVNEKKKTLKAIHRIERIRSSIVTAKMSPYPTVDNVVNAQ
jgi:hypothetical protein